MTAIVKRTEKASTQVFTGMVALSPFARSHFARVELRKHLSWRREGTIDGAFLFCQVVCDHVGVGLGKLLLRFIEGLAK